MKSKTSFFKLTLESLRRNKTAIFITVIGYILYLFLFAFKLKQNENPINTPLFELWRPSQIENFVASLTGVYLGCAFFRHLHSKSETDFYNSMPIRKIDQFCANTVACISLYTIIIVAVTGFKLLLLCQVPETYDYLIYLLYDFIAMYCAFLVSWISAVLAMTITGRLSTAIFMTLMLIYYIGYIGISVFTSYASTFFQTAYHPEQNYLYYLSPFTLMYQMSYPSNMKVWTLEGHWPYINGCILYTLILWIISYLLFKKRPAEAAGQTMAFPKLTDWIRFALVIPYALFIGRKCYYRLFFDSYFWIYFPTIFGCIMLFVIFEGILHHDIRAAFRKKLQLVISIVLCIGIISVFRYDIFGHDQKVPKASSLSSITIEVYAWGEKLGTDTINKKITDEKEIEQALIALDEARINNLTEKSTNKRFQLTYTVTYQYKIGIKQYRQYKTHWDYIPTNTDTILPELDFNDW